MKRRNGSRGLGGLVAVLAVAAGVSGAVPAPGQDSENPIVALVKERVADPAKPFVLVVYLKAKPGKAEALERAFAPAVAATLKEKGCLQYTLSRDPAKPGEYLLFERWSRVEDLAAHLKTPHIGELMKAFEEVNAEPPRAEVLVPVAG
jgi:quinol monooxygenase YgiN